MSIPNPPTIAGMPEKPRKRRMWLGAATILTGMAISCCGGFFAGSGGDTKAEVVYSPSPYAVTKYETVQPPTPAAAPTSAAAAPAPPTVATIEDGTWTVGEDFPAGTYKIKTPVTSACYWGIYKSGTNQGTILENDIVTGGRPTVTLRKGQDFKSDCGTWVKTK